MKFIKTAIRKIKIWWAWEYVSDAHDHARGYYRLENKITGDRRQVHPEGCPYTVKSWASQASGQGYHYDRLACKFYPLRPPADTPDEIYKNTQEVQRAKNKDGSEPAYKFYGHVCGHYTNPKTGQQGYVVSNAHEPGLIQIFPYYMLEKVDKPKKPKG